MTTKITHNLSIISNNKMPFLHYIKSGQKKAECRIATEKIRNFKLGDNLKLTNNQEFIICEITFLHFYMNFKDMIITEGLKNLLPFINTLEDGIKIYNSFPGGNRVLKFGCCAIGVKYIYGNLTTRMY